MQCLYLYDSHTCISVKNRLQLPDDLIININSILNFQPSYNSKFMQTIRQVTIHTASRQHGC